MLCKRVILADGRIADADLSREQHPAGGREQGAEDIGQDRRPIDPRSQPIGRHLVGSYGPNAHSETRLAQHDLKADRDDHDHDESRRQEAESAD